MSSRNGSNDDASCIELYHLSLSESAASRRIGPFDAPRDFFTAFAFDNGYVVLALKIDPEQSAVAEIMSKPHGSVGRDRAAAI
jgi:hypothetical protein